MLIEKIILNRDACFLDSDCHEVVLKKGTHLSFLEEPTRGLNRLLIYVDDCGNKYTSNDAEFPSEISPYVKVVKDGLFYEVSPFGTHIKTAILPVGTLLRKLSNGLLTSNNNFYTTDNYSCLENEYEFPKVKVSAEVKSKPKFELDANKKYAGQDGIDAAILFLQTTDLSKHIIRDDNKDIFVDLGSSEMWPDIDNAQWIMKLNSLIPIASAVSVGKRILKGKPRLAIGLHSNFV